MSIKKLFNSTENNRKYLSDTTEKDAFSPVESGRNVQSIQKEQEAFVPQIDYSNPAKFARYGSAYLYYDSAINRILDFYPYDGSNADYNEFYNGSLEIEKYIFNNRYPRTHGYIRFSNEGWGTRDGTQRDGYGLSDTPEHISFYGGPGTASFTTADALKDYFPDKDSQNYKQANIYETDIYTREGLPDNYGSGTRLSNLRSNFDTGVTVEFWLKKEAFTTGSTAKEVVFDMWNTNSTASADYGRITIELSGASTGSPFRITAQSGTSGIFQQRIGNDLTTSTLEDFKHYAVVLQNSGSALVTKLYVNGELNDTNYRVGTVNEISSKNLAARIGSLISSPSGSTAEAGWGKMSASMDEFRFWKTSRNSEQIAENWFTQVYGGTNSDVSNATLGVYYKFNEGIVGTASVDSVILDYSGRVTNGAWTGYVTGSRTTDSAIIIASASATEYKDPIIYAEHPDVISLKTELLDSGTEHDANNNTAFSTLLPNWIHEEEKDSKTSDTKLISHIVGTYLDKLYMQIEAVSTFKAPTYTSASYKPIPFAQHLPQSLGLYMPEIFVEANVLESFTNRDNNSLFEGDLTETKNLIYLNLYNNLSNIYKAKGTEKSIRNVFRCFNVDERLIRLNVYSNNQTYELKNNLKQTLRRKASINFDNENNLSAVVYSAQSGSGANSVNYISGSNALGYENKYGFTLEADVTFPSFDVNEPPYDLHKLWPSASVFGMRSASINSDVGTTLPATDYANFDVYVVQDKLKSKNAYFKLTSSNAPYTFPELTSSIFYNVYDSDRWNLSVRLKPSNYPVTDIVSGSGLYTYDLEFRGVNTLLGTTQDSFLLTASVSQALGKSMLNSAKRVYAGATRTNVTGTLLKSSNAIFSGIRYWGRYVDASDLDQHAADVDNVGISGSYQNISPLDSNNEKYDLINNNLLFLDWSFNKVTGSDASGNFYVQDMSSGSAALSSNYGWLGNLSNRQHTGYGYGFAASSTDVVRKEIANSFKFTDPESPISSDMIQILSEDDTIFKITENVPSFFYSIEKSMYNAISEEMLDFFAGAVDFNNVIGEPVNRYRERYKTMEKLREAFFRRATKVSDVEKFINYYKWLDDAITSVISQLIPASVEFSDGVLNTVESHVLERNKYQSKFPTIEFAGNDPDTPIMGINEKLYSWRLNHHPVNNQQNTNSPWWVERANRETNAVISMPVPLPDAANADRETIRKSIANDNNSSASLLTTDAKGGYYGSTYVLRKLAKPYKLDMTRRQVFKGGVNFTNNKNMEFTRNALAPAGPVNHEGGVFVPQNVLLGFDDSFVPLKDTVDVTQPNKKVKRYLKVQPGREWKNGLGYSNVKSSYAFPFNIISSSITTGYNAQVARASSSIEFVNLHYDAYGPDLEVPMQGPFTNYAVGGLQSRHVPINTASLDDWKNRPEAWKILLGECSSSTGVTGAIGMVGADYPFPEANDEGMTPYPMTGAQKAVYYRDHIAKRPVNIRNIRMRTGSTIIGNYSHNYEVVSSVGAYSNPRGFVDNPPTLPTQITETPSASQGRTYFGIHRVEGYPAHIELIPSYSIGYLRHGHDPAMHGYVTQSANKSIIRGRFSAPGEIATLGLGYRDLRSGEYSVYNTLNYRNLTVRKPLQPPSGNLDAAIIGAAYIGGTPGIKSYDIHGKDYGLNALLSRHCGRFGRDSFLVTDPGASYEQSASFIKINRNRRPYLIDASDSGVVTTSSQYDNFWVQHPIPRNDRQYAWVTNSLAANSEDIRYYGHARTHGVFAGLYSASSGYTAFFNYVTASDVCAPRDRLFGSDNYLQVTNRLNLFTVDPVNNVANTEVSNSLGYAFNTDMLSYLNVDLLKANNVFTQFDKVEDAFNLLMTRRGSSYGWSWNSDRNSQHPVLQRQRKNNIYSIYSRNKIENYVVQPVSKRGYPVRVNMDVDQENITLVVSHGLHGQNRHFNSVDLNNLLITNDSQYDSTLSQIINIAASTDTYGINWVLYSEALFPSMNMEYSSSTRPSYNNKMWRTSPITRVNVGSTQVVTNSYGETVSQSCWPLDAPQGFLTRSSQPIISSTSHIALRTSQPAGELQNVYSLVAEATAAALSAGGTSLRPRNLRAGALYARKHCLPSPKSVVSPSCMNIPETGSETNPYSDKIHKFAGEAVWEAAAQAGIVAPTADGTTEYISYHSEPWFNNYDDFHYELNLVARDYSIVPEFRISEHVEDYIKFGALNSRKTNTFEIPGTGINSSTSSFYRDYSNSEFMSSFATIDSLDDTLSPSEIRLVCSASIRLNPYKGFFPAQRSLDLTTQFSKSFGPGMAANLNNVVANLRDGNTRPTMAALFAPGILYNSIKSGMAVDYPIVTDPVRIRTASYGRALDPKPNWMITNDWQAEMTKTQGYLGGAYFNRRIPFEAIISPDKYLDGTKFFNVEPDPSCSLDVTGTFSTARADSIYTMMASNFFGEVVNFYLKDSKLTEMRSEMVSPNLRFSEGDMFFGRLSIGQTYSGIRSYQYESGASGDNLAYDKFGAKQFIDGNFVSGTAFPIPQYPRQNPQFRRDHVMYSRPSAFGPAVSGQPTGAFGVRHPKVSASSPVDSMYGFNWAYTPPYYDGEAWIDFIFYPTASESYDLERVLAETKTVFWRADAGPSASVAPPTAGALSPHDGMAGTQLIATFSGTLGATYGDSIYDGKNVNDNAMQLSASVNYFGVERIQKERKDARGNKENTENEIVGMKWVIQPKWETPILNFADKGTHPISNASDTLTLPQFGSASVPRGMWHQFGVIPAEHQGIFLKFGEIPTQWLQYHYDVVQTASAYNDYKVLGASKIHSRARPLTDIVKFDDTNSKVKLGSIAEKRTISEAVVAVPYLVDGRNAGETGANSPSGQNSMNRKSFFSIPRTRIDACLNENIGTRDGDSLNAAGESIRKLVQRMERYVLPPQFDWLSNSNIEPIAMYMFEFEYSFDKDDLNYMWQNLAPKDYKKMSFDIHSVAHELLDTELMSVEDLRKDNLRWMVFKVKQKSQTVYSDLIASTVGQSDKEEKKPAKTKEDGYKIQFNWPYDFVSFVELVKFDTEVLYKPTVPSVPSRRNGRYQQPDATRFNQQKGGKKDDPYEKDVQAPKNVVYGCMDEDATNYNPQADAHDPLKCKYEKITGCLDPAASNYDSSATHHDQSHCKYESTHTFTYGCKDEEALNYNDTAQIHDPNDCVYSVAESVEAHEELTQEISEDVEAAAAGALGIVSDVTGVSVDIYGDME